LWSRLGWSESGKIGEYRAKGRTKSGQNFTQMKQAFMPANGFVSPSAELTKPHDREIKSQKFFDTDAATTLDQPKVPVFP